MGLSKTLMCERISKHVMHLKDVLLLIEHLNSASLAYPRIEAFIQQPRDNIPRQHQPIEQRLQIEGH